MEGLAKHGVKRKRESLANVHEDTPSKLRAKLHHALKEVKKATKKVKTFETQRVVKKLKDARKNGDESNVKSLEAQLECLKHIDVDDIAVRAFRSRIKKDALLSRNADCQEAVSAVRPLSQNKQTNDLPVRGLIESRMLSSKILSAEVANATDSLKAILGLGRQETPVTGEESNASDAEGRVKSEGEKADAPPHRRKDRAEEKASVIEEDDEETNEESNDGAAWTGFERVHSDAEQSSDAEDSESNSLHSQAKDHQESISKDPRSKTSQSLRTKRTHIDAKGGESTFLPSLAVGFISGSSDSEWSDAEAKIADLPVKKNRRGQRARKAIWEKKYGKNANHLRKQRENEVQNAMRAAYGQRGGGRGRGVVRGRGRSITSVTRISSPHTKASHQFHHGRDQDVPQRNRNALQIQSDSVREPPSNVRPLHPSWEAKRRLKERENPVIVPSTGTRIKFT